MAYIQAHTSSTDADGNWIWQDIEVEESHYEEFRLCHCSEEYYSTIERGVNEGWIRILGQ